MRRLMLLRHAKSDWPGGVSDFERPLAKRGREAAPAMGAYMKAHGLMPDLVLVSTARRTRETWALVQAALGADTPARFEQRIYEAYPEHLLALAHGLDPSVRTVLFVGHNPGTEELASDLIGGGDMEAAARLRRKYPTCGLTVLDFDGDDWAMVTEASGRLERFATPASIGDGPDE
jgi:phosphohistidine phosphatase